MIVFGSGLFTNDVVNLKHQGAAQKLMIGWHKHQGVSETPKNADVICEQPRTRGLLFNWAMGQDTLRGGATRRLVLPRLSGGDKIVMGDTIVKHLWHMWHTHVNCQQEGVKVEPEIMENLTTQSSDKRSP